MSPFDSFVLTGHFIRIILLAVDNLLLSPSGLEPFTSRSAVLVAKRCAEPLDPNFKLCLQRNATTILAAFCLEQGTVASERVIDACISMFGDMVSIYISHVPASSTCHTQPESHLDSNSFDLVRFGFPENRYLR